MMLSGSEQRELKIKCMSLTSSKRIPAQSRRGPNSSRIIRIRTLYIYVGTRCARARAKYSRDHSLDDESS